MTNIVFIATSLDGYIADKEGRIDWLYSVPNPENKDTGWERLMARIDAIILGRKTFETVCGFAGDWPYSKPVFVLSNTREVLPDEYRGKAELIRGPLLKILEDLRAQGRKNLYIDGGATIRSFLKEDLIDEMIISTFPVLLGGGTPLFTELPKPLTFAFTKSEIQRGAIVISHYVRAH